MSSNGATLPELELYAVNPNAAQSSSPAAAAHISGTLKIDQRDRQTSPATSTWPDAVWTALSRRSRCITRRTWANQRSWLSVGAHIWCRCVPSPREPPARSFWQQARLSVRTLGLREFLKSGWNWDTVCIFAQRSKPIYSDTSHLLGSKLV